MSTNCHHASATPAAMHGVEPTRAVPGGPVPTGIALPPLLVRQALDRCDAYIEVLAHQHLTAMGLRSGAAPLPPGGALLVRSFTIDGAESRDMYDEHPGLAYFKVRISRRYRVSRYWTMEEAMRRSLAAFERMQREHRRQDGDPLDWDGRFAPDTIVLHDQYGTPVQEWRDGHWCDDLPAPERLAGLREGVAGLRAEAAIEAGWDNHETARALRLQADRIERRVAMAARLYDTARP